MEGNRKATYYKAAGGDFGAVKVARWVRFSCLHCARMQYPESFRGPLAQRWQGPPSPAVDKAMRGAVVVSCKGPEMHRIAIEADAATRAR